MGLLYPLIGYKLHNSCLIKKIKIRQTQTEGHSIKQMTNTLWNCQGQKKKKPRKNLHSPKKTGKHANLKQC